MTRNPASAQAEADAAKAEARAAKAASGKVIYETGTSVIFFRYGVSKLTDREKVRLDLIADMINKAPRTRSSRSRGMPIPRPVRLPATSALRPTVRRTSTSTSCRKA